MQMPLRLAPRILVIRSGRCAEIALFSRDVQSARSEHVSALRLCLKIHRVTQGLSLARAQRHQYRSSSGSSSGNTAINGSTMLAGIPFFAFCQ